MALEMNPEFVNDADRQLEARILESGNSYAAANAESKKLNKKRAEVRAKIKEMGVRTDAYQTAIHIIKDLTPEEGKVFLSDLEMLVRILGAKQQDLFAEEQVKAQKRVEKAQAKAAGKPRTPEEIDAANQDNPRSDPNSGGAKPQTPPDPPSDPNPSGEQEEGDKVLEAQAPVMSQSQKAAKKRAAAGLN